MDPVATSRPSRPRSFWVAGCLALVLLVSLLFNGLFVAGLVAAVVVAGGDSDAGNYTEVLLDGKDSDEDKVVVIPVHGVIADETTDHHTDSIHTASDMHAVLHHLRNDKHVKAIILDVDSPGGGVTASDVMYHDLKQYRQDSGVPIVALFGDVAASGGYYLSMASDEIMAHTTTVTGSIGVISHFPNYSGLMEKVGVKVEVIKSLNSAGGTSMKDIGSPFRPMTPEERKLLQDLITQMWQQFVSVVQTGRKGRIPADQVPALADGRVFSGSAALKLKLVDSIGYAEDAWKRARTLAHADNAKIVKIRRVPRLTEMFSSSRTDVVTTLIDKVSASASDDSPRLLYLWPGR